LARLLQGAGHGLPLCCRDGAVVPEIMPGLLTDRLRVRAQYPIYRQAPGADLIRIKPAEIRKTKPRRTTKGTKNTKDTERSKIKPTVKCGLHEAN